MQKLLETHHVSDDELVVGRYPSHWWRSGRYQWVAHHQSHPSSLQKHCRFSHTLPLPPYQLLHEQDLILPGAAVPVLAAIQQIDHSPHQGPHSKCLTSDSVLPEMKLELVQGLYNPLFSQHQNCFLIYLTHFVYGLLHLFWNGLGSLLLEGGAVE